MAKKKKTLQSKAAKATITKKNKDDSVEETEEQVGENKMFEDPPCNVGYTAGVTLPMPNNQYSNVKFGVSLYIPCPHDEIDETYEFAQEWVDKRMNDLIEDFEDDD